MRKITLLILLIGLCTICKAQTEREKAIDLKNHAVELMDNGKIDESIKILERAQQIDPDFITIPYEIAFAYQLTKEYDKSIEIAKPLLKHPDVFDLVYQLIGNSYDLKGNKAKAIKMYDKGIKKFPNSGKLHLEKGIVMASQEKWFEALDIWEQGIVADPSHSSNYYYASQVLAQTDERIWGVYYGEIFLNLEPNSQRSAQISKLLYDTYKTCFPIKNNKWGLQFSHKATNIVLGDLKDIKFSFETIHNLVMEQGYKGVEPEFTIDNLINIRKQFLEEWNAEYAERYPNLIFDYHDLLIKNKMFEPYMYWTLKGGAENEFQIWKSNNASTHSKFIEWFNNNPMSFPDDRKTNRFSY